MKKGVAFLLIFLLVINLVHAIDQDFYKKLISKGYSSEEATKITIKYDDENQFLDAVREAVDNEDKEMLGIPIERIKIDFYKPGVVSQAVSKWWSGSWAIYDGFEKFFKGLFGDTPGGLFKWFVGVKKEGIARFTDLIVGLLTSLAVAGLYYLSCQSMLKSKYKAYWTPKDVNAKNERLKWLRRLVGKYKNQISDMDEVSWLKTLIIFPLIYFALFQIPIINRILEFITFYHFMPGSATLGFDILPNIFIRTLFSWLIIAFFMDFLPALLDMRRKQIEEKNKLRKKVGEAIIKELGKVDEGTLRKLTEDYTS